VALGILRQPDARRQHRAVPQGYQRVLDDPHGSGKSRDNHGQLTHWRSLRRSPEMVWCLALYGVGSGTKTKGLPGSFDRQTRRTLGALPSPLWGGVGGGGGGRAIEAPMVPNSPPPSPALPHKGGGSRPSLPLSPRQHKGKPRSMMPQSLRRRAAR